MDADQIYEAAFIPELWPVVLEGLCRLTESWGAALIAIDARHNYRFAATEGYLPLLRSFTEQAADYRSLRAERGLAKRPHGFLSDLDVCTEAELAVDRVYQEFLRPAGVGWTAGTVLPLPSGELLIFDLNRSISRGPFEPAAIARLDRLRPELARAALAGSRLGLERVRAAAETLSLIGIPAAVLAPKGRVIAMNDEFERLAGQYETGARDRLRLRDRAADQLLAGAIARFGEGETTSVASIPVAGVAGAPATVFHLIPVRRQAHDIFASADAILVGTPITAPAAPLTEMLNVLFDLTPAEGRLARAIFEGQTLREAARAWGLSEQTLRGRLKAVFAKTGTSRQADLVRLLNGVNPSLRL